MHRQAVLPFTGTSNTARMGWQGPHEAQQGEMRSPAPGTEQPHGPIQAGAALQERPRSWSWQRAQQEPEEQSLPDLLVFHNQQPFHVTIILKFL